MAVKVASERSVNCCSDWNTHNTVPDHSVSENKESCRSMVPNITSDLDNDGYLKDPIKQEDNGNYQRSLRRLEGKVAIITGGARGIGEASTRLFVKHGANVVIADIEDDEGKMVSESLSPAVTYMHCDVSNEEDVAHVVNMTVSKYGKLDIMFNNAGILGEQAKRKSIMDFDAEEFDNVMGVNVKGVCLGMKHAARIMVPRRSGCIISTASVAGVQGGLGPHAYTASKHAIIGLTKNTACELGKYGIRVNCISPFGVPTSMLINAWKKYEGEMSDDVDDQEQRVEDFVRSLANLKGQTLSATDIAEAALYLVSDEAKYVSGHNLVVDGGITSINNCVGL